MQYKLKSVYWEAHGNINTYTAVLVFTARHKTKYGYLVEKRYYNLLQNTSGVTGGCQGVQ